MPKMRNSTTWTAHNPKLTESFLLCAWCFYLPGLSYSGIKINYSHRFATKWASLLNITGNGQPAIKPDYLFKSHSRTHLLAFQPAKTKMVRAHFMSERHHNFFCPCCYSRCWNLLCSFQIISIVDPGINMENPNSIFVIAFTCSYSKHTLENLIF